MRRSPIVLTSALWFLLMVASGWSQSAQAPDSKPSPGTPSAGSSAPAQDKPSQPQAAPTPEPDSGDKTQKQAKPENTATAAPTQDSQSQTDNAAASQGQDSRSSTEKPAGAQAEDSQPQTDKPAGNQVQDSQSSTGKSGASPTQGSQSQTGKSGASQPQDSQSSTNKDAANQPQNSQSEEKPGAQAQDSQSSTGKPAASQAQDSQSSTNKAASSEDEAAQPDVTSNPLPQPAAPAQSKTASSMVADTRPPAQPKTDVLDSSATSGALATDGHDPILDPPPLPAGVTSLVGGVISNVDRIRNHLTVAIFGGGHWTVYFDERTHIFRNGAQATVLALRKGERVYVDTMLDNNNRDIFARNIRVGIVTLPADAAGQITDVDAEHGSITIRDNISQSRVHFAVDKSTLISYGTTPMSIASLRAGSLVRVKFSPDRPSRGLAREITVLAAPGSVFTFAGTITYLDTHRQLLAVRNASDNKIYDIHFVPGKTPELLRLLVGARVQVIAAFESTGYIAQQVTVMQMAGADKK